MPFRRTSEASTVADAAPETARDYDVMALRRVTDHPALQPLVARRHGLVARLQALEQEHLHLDAQRQDLEKSEAHAVAVLGADWNPTAQRQLKDALAEHEAEANTLRAGLELLDQEIDAVTSGVRDDIEVAFDRLRQPLLAKVIAALESITDANRSIHAIEGLSQRLLQVSKHHLYDASLEQRLALMQRTEHLMALAALGTDAP